MAIYMILIIYPLYRILMYVTALDLLFQTILLGGLSLVFIGIVLGMPEFIVIYYIIAGLVYKVNYVFGAPGFHDIILYSIFILHADILSKMITIGVGSRKIRVKLWGIPFTIIVPVIIVGSYVALAYYVLNMFMGIVDNVIYSSELARIVFTTFLSTRIGSLMLFVFIVFAVFFVLTNYVTDLVSDTIWLNPSYARQRIIDWIKREYDELLKNKTWHQKLYTGAITTLLLFAVMSIIYPLLYDVFGFLVEMGFGEQLKYFAFFVSLPVSYVFGRSFKNWAYGMVSSERFKSSVEREIRFVLRVPKSDPFLYLLLTLAYVFFLLYINPDIVYHAIYTVLGITPPQPTTTGIFGEIIDLLNRLVEYINTNTIPYLNNYISRATSEYKGLIGIIKTVIKVLWG